MKIAILTLTRQRDKFIDNMLADELREYGHEVVVRNYIQAGRETILYDKPDCVIHPMPGGQYKYDFIKQCKDWGIKVIVRRGEAGMGWRQFKSIDDDGRRLMLGNWDYSPYVDLELTWGQEFTDIIAEEGHMPAEKLKACGAFAFDPYFQKQPPRKQKPKTILFATGFSTADCRSEYCECGLPEESDYHERIYKIHRAARDRWIDSICELVKWYKDDWRFELKVRPGEMAEEYRARLPIEVKIHPVGAASSEVLQGVDVLIHSGSTMAIEAYLLKIACFNYCNVNPDPLLAEVSPILNDHKSLEWSISQVIPGMTTINEGPYEEIKSHLYGKVDGKACLRAAMFIDEYLGMSEALTDIPNVWPKTTAYHEDKVNVKLSKTKGFVSWLCPCCRETYYVKKNVDSAKCPYCSMGIAKSEGPAKAVLK